MAGGPSLENIFSDISHARIIELLRAQENSSEYSVSNLPPVEPKAGDVYIFVPLVRKEYGMFTN